MKRAEFQISPDGPSREMLLMIRSLLRERFKRLVPQAKGQVDVLVIDSVEHPTAD